MFSVAQHGCTAAAAAAVAGGARGKAGAICGTIPRLAVATPRDCMRHLCSTTGLTQTLTQAQRGRTVAPAFWRARAARLEAEDRARCLCRDPQAELLAKALLPVAERDALEASPKADDEMLIAGVRAAFMDRFVLDAVGRRVRQVVLLGAGMDSRAFRLDVPPQLTLTEVDAAPVLEAKAQVLGAAGQRSRCAVRQAPLDLAADTGAAQSLAKVLVPALVGARRAGLLFLLDGALEAWPTAAQAAAFEALAALAPEGSTVVGPAPSDEAIEILTAGGFARINKVNHLQLRKIFGVPVPEGTGMLVAMHGPQEGPARPAAEPLGGGTSGGGRGKEVQF